MKREVTVRFMDRQPPLQMQWDRKCPSGTAFVVGGWVYANEQDVGSDGPMTQAEERDFRDAVRDAFWAWMGKAKAEATHLIEGPRGES
jgi:hypothetical protein